MEDHECEMCGSVDEDLVSVSGVGVICVTCERREFGPFDQDDEA
jgi:hypothetical protein